MTVATRRERLRAETIAEIKDRAWALMSEAGPDALSLREVARQMGMSPSALYRYFASRNDLLTALIIDGYDSLTAVLRTEYERLSGTVPTPTSGDMLAGVGLAYRRWALEHRVEWMLIFSTSIPDYNGTEDTTAASIRASSVLNQVIADAVAAGDLDLERIDRVVDDTMRPPLEQWAAADNGFGLPPAALTAAVWCYAITYGAIALELNGHLPPALLDNESLFVTSLGAVIAQILK